MEGVQVDHRMSTLARINIADPRDGLKRGRFKFSFQTMLASGENLLRDKVPEKQHSAIMCAVRSWLV